MGAARRCSTEHPQSTQTASDIERIEALAPTETDQTCAFFLRTGTCAFGGSCRFHHPADELPELRFNQLGLPLREGEPVCEFYSKHGCCGFGKVCKFDHPDSVLAAAADAAASSGKPFPLPGMQSRAAPMMAARPPPYAAYMHTQTMPPYSTPYHVVPMPHMLPPMPASPFASAAMPASMLMPSLYTSLLNSQSSLDPMLYGHWRWLPYMDTAQLRSGDNLHSPSAWSPPVPAHSPLQRSASGGPAGRRRSGQSTPASQPSPPPGMRQPDAASVVVVRQAKSTEPGSVLANLLPSESRTALSSRAGSGAPVDPATPAKTPGTSPVRSPSPAEDTCACEHAKEPATPGEVHAEDGHATSTTAQHINSMVAAAAVSISSLKLPGPLIKQEEANGGVPVDGGSRNNGHA
ncbi:hypothetical protein WJX72_000115 [[Myrmecia] bisecta]|uniref:C3H1-type domain-containing protein n=1 Tax=[Myrmecia] bisecta TaxID=41462 RepID=A0AAW1QDV5_9CHLO